MTLHTHTYTATSVIASMPRFDSWVVTYVVGITLMRTVDQPEGF